MKQYKITGENYNTHNSDIDDCALSADDPIHELKALAGLGELGGQARLMEYRAKGLNTTENITHTAAETVRIMKEKNIKPGTPEWFQLWFSLPHMTGEKKFGK
jgi:hypothetical protein